MYTLGCFSGSELTLHLEPALVQSWKRGPPQPLGLVSSPLSGVCMSSGLPSSSWSCPRVGLGALPRPWEGGQLVPVWHLGRVCLALVLAGIHDTPVHSAFYEICGSECVFYI